MKDFTLISDSGRSMALVDPAKVVAVTRHGRPRDTTGGAIVTVHLQGGGAFESDHSLAETLTMLAIQQNAGG